MAGDVFPHPDESFFYDHAGLRMHYVDAGPRDAPPVVMLHGNPTWSFYYRGLIDALRGTHRCVVPDHIGMGLSDKPRETHYDYTLEHRVLDVGRLINHLKLGDDITLVVHDWGGMIGFAWAVREVERVRRIVVMNTAAFRLPSTQPLPVELKLCRSPIGPMLVRGLNLFCRGTVRKGVVMPLAGDVRSAYLKPYDSWANRVAVMRFVQDIPLADDDRAMPIVREVEDGLHKLSDKPTMICWGMKDFVFTPKFLDEWVERAPWAVVHRFDNAGHLVLEDEAEAIVALVQSFMNV